MAYELIRSPALLPEVDPQRLGSTLATCTCHQGHRRPRWAMRRALDRKRREVGRRARLPSRLRPPPGGARENLSSGSRRTPCSRIGHAGVSLAARERLPGAPQRPQRTANAFPPPPCAPREIFDRMHAARALTPLARPLRRAANAPLTGAEDGHVFKLLLGLLLVR